MSRAEFIRFLQVLEEDTSFRALFAQAEPEEILRLADQNGFDFSDEIKGRFLNRWAGVYFCPFANDVGRLCPKMVPEGMRRFCITLKQHAAKMTRLNASTSELVDIIQE